MSKRLWCKVHQPLGAVLCRWFGHKWGRWQSLVHTGHDLEFRWCDRCCDALEHREVTP